MRNPGRMEWDGVGEKPKSWRGKFIICCCENFLRGDGKLVMALSSSLKLHERNLTGEYRQLSFSFMTGKDMAWPTLFDTKSEAEKVACRFIDGRYTNWGMEGSYAKPFGCRVMSRGKMIPVLKLVKAEEYKVFRRQEFQRAMKEYSSEKGVKVGGKHGVKTSKPDSRGDLGKTEVRSVKAEGKNQLGMKGARATSKPVSKVGLDRPKEVSYWFIVREMETGDYLAMPRSGEVSLARLVSVMDDCTYFTRIEDANRVALWIESQFWVSEYNRWRLKVERIKPRK